MGKVLVLCVDRDDDLGRKAKIKGPVIGEEKNIKAANALLMADPGEADGNTIFEAVRIKKSNKDAVEVVTITGDRNRGYRADREVLKQLDKVLKKFADIEGVILVTDGADDDELIPIIQSRVKIISKRVLLVKQAQQLEKSYYVLKEVLKDPNFARLIFGLPGIILLTLSFLEEMGMKIIIFVIGLYLLLKGFGFEEPIINLIHSFRETTSVERASFPLYIASLIMILLSFWAGAQQMGTAESRDVVVKTATFVEGFMFLFTMGLLLFILGRIGDMYYRNEPHKIKKYLLSSVTVVSMWMVVTSTAELIVGKIPADLFIMYLFAIFIGTIIGLAVVRNFYIKRFIVMRIKKGMEVYDQHGEIVGTAFNINKEKQRLTIKGKDAPISLPLKDVVLVKDYIIIRKRF
ncbi:hypothetical protein DRN74_01940 [Candidatus Micrarchaeota archaeon]|nr:MAG: hypothetical protein DRN74_01940 [Candidatus Micrarchaeota archaeon]